MVLPEIFLSKKSDPNIHQNAPNCTIFKKFLGGTCPRTPLASRHANLQKILGHPPSQILGTPVLADSYVE